MTSYLLSAISLSILCLTIDVRCSDQIFGNKGTNNLLKDGPKLSIADLSSSTKSFPEKIVNILTESEYDEERSKSLSLLSKEHLTSNDRSDIEPRIHIHHVFPPDIIRPLQRLIVFKLMHKLKGTPQKKFKRRFKAKAGAALLGASVATGVHAMGGKYFDQIRS